jgi:phage terminase small subunit
VIERHRQFAKEYAISGNATSSAITAGYSAKTAHQQGYQLLKHPSVVAELARLKHQSEKKTDLSLARIEQKLSNLLDFDLSECIGDDGKLLKLKDIPPHIRQSITAFENDKGFQKIKSVSPLSVIELIMKLKGYGRQDNVQVAITTVLLQDKPVSELPVIDQTLALKPEW